MTVPNLHDILLQYGLAGSQDWEYAKEIQQALRQADATEVLLLADQWPRELRFYHGTSWSSAQLIMAQGFIASADGLLGPGVYVGQADKALKFAQNGIRHGGAAGGLIEVLVEIRNPKFVSSDEALDPQWREQGYDACRADRTIVSPNMEWCVADAAKVKVVKITKVPLAPEPFDGDGLVEISVNSSVAGHLAILTVKRPTIRHESLQLCSFSSIHEDS